MNKKTINLTRFAFSLCFLFLIFGAIASYAQTNKNAVSKNILAYTLKRKDGLTNKFTSNTGDPCDSAISAAIGQTHGGALNNTDCRLDDGSYADFFIFEGTQGQTVTITMNSSQIDSYLGLANLSGTFTVEDDDSGGGLTARIIATLPETGTYVVLANSAMPNSFGGYTLVLGGSQPCTFTLTPSTISIPAQGGTFSFNLNTQTHCYWQAFSLNNFTTTNSSGIGSGTVTFVSTQNGSGQNRTGSLIVSTAPLVSTYNYFEISQPSVSCNYSLSPSSVNVSPTSSSGSFQITAPAGCPWTVESNSGFVSASGSGAGNGTVNYSVMHNNGAARVGIINVGGQTFTINQAGLNCEFNITPREIRVSRFASTRTISVNTQPGCNWSATTNVNHITLLNNLGTGSGTITFNISALTDSNSRSGAVQVWYGNSSTPVWIDQDIRYSSPVFDYDGDGKADVSVFRPSVGGWYISQSSNNAFIGVGFGIASDVIAPADFDGDGKTDISVFRDGNWYRLNSSNNSFSAVNFGLATDLPVPADFDGDGKADISVYRPSNGGWYRLNSSNGTFATVNFGTAEDKPTLGDFDSDGKTDIAVFRPSNSAWYRLNSSNGSFSAVTFGVAGDKPVPADYDGDGRTDVAVYRPSNGTWYRLNSSSGAFAATAFGASEDKPTAADYDGDGFADIAVFRPSNGTWYQLKSTAGFAAQAFGTSGDIPTPNAFVR